MTRWVEEFTSLCDPWVAASINAADFTVREYSRNHITCLVFNSLPPRKFPIHHLIKPTVISAITHGSRDAVSGYVRGHERAEPKLLDGNRSQM